MRISIIFLLMAFRVGAQTTAGFENFGLPLDTFRNNAGPSGLFASGRVALPNDYDPGFDAWEGWAISSKRDTLKPGFQNQYSAIAGKGAEGSATYAVGYAFDKTILKLTGPAAGGVVNGLYVANSTYAYRSMKDGDAFSKKFGGETGNDPDFFLLTIQKYRGGVIRPEKVAFYLADYRAAGQSQDYLVKNWVYLDLRVLGNVDSLVFSLSSSDNGSFGMNTPAYFCMDNVVTADQSVAAPEPDRALAAQVSPNPATDFLRVDWREPKPGVYRLREVSGRNAASGTLQNGANTIDLSALPPQLYLLEMANDSGRSVFKFVKN
jgi:Domain of unknown function (DUF4465)